MTGKAAELYAAYEADKLLIQADPTLTGARRDRLITRLTDELEEAEGAAGVKWEPAGRVEVKASEHGTKAINPRKENG